MSDPRSQADILEQRLEECREARRAALPAILRATLLTLRAGDVLVLHGAPSADGPGMCGAAVTAVAGLHRLLKEDGYDVFLIYLPHGWDLEKCDEHQMQEHGWQRKEGP